MHSDYEHYSYFLSIYKRMAKAIIGCQKLDSDGNGFWTQSMLQNYPIGNNGNDEGYETSGTGFFTYGLFWGLNSGILDEKTYLEPALRGWKYLSEVALQDNGLVGYIQEIGSKPTSATALSSSHDFGYGAFLLAGCEASRWINGVSENNELYLTRKLWGALAFNGSKYYSDGTVYTKSASFTENGTVYLPVEETADLLDCVFDDEAGGYSLTAPSHSGFIASEKIIEKDGVLYASAADVASALGKHVSQFGDVTVISHKRVVFYDCDANAITAMQAVLAE